MRHARPDCDIVVVTLFVNPTQFRPGEDFEAYPRDFERDCALAAAAGADYMFNPEVEEMYPDGFKTCVQVEGLSEIMCGEFRPGHFRGVATVVAKLFNIVPAQKAYFGQKDGQQLAVIRQMARDMDFPVEVVAVPTVREEDGLAKSSRNIYLGVQDRADALVLHRALVSASEMIASGERDAATVVAGMERVFATVPSVNLEYIAICDNIYLRPLDEMAGQVMIAVAARVGKARLIDNMVFEIK
jgi:pantoate--beta-alanine ligase